MVDSVLQMIYEDAAILLVLFAVIFCLTTIPAITVILINEARRNKQKALEERFLAEERAAYARRSKPEAL